MAIKPILTIIIILLLLFIPSCKDTEEQQPISNQDRPYCGDSICQDQEKTNGFCPKDCGEQQDRPEPIEDDMNTNEKDYQGYIGDMLEQYPDVEVQYDIQYADDHESLLLDIYSPKEITENLPAIVFIHGGAFSGGTKLQVGGHAIKLANEGFIVASIDYRLTSQGYEFPTPVHDTKAAVRWLRANSNTYNIDKDNIGAIGGSAGGYFVSMLGTSGDVTELEGTVGNNLDQSSTLQAVVDLFGPSDFNTLAEDCEGVCAMDKATPTSPESKFIGCVSSDCPEIAEEASFITYVSSDDPPFLIIHGDEDETIPQKQSERFYEALQNNNIESELIIAEGYGHGTQVLGNHQIITEVYDFFDNNLN